MWGVWGGVVPGARSFWERCKPPRDGGADPGQAAAGRGGGGGGTGCPRPGPLLSPSPCRWLRGSEGSAGSQRVTGVFRGRGKHACAAASPAAVGLRRGNTRSGSRTQVKRRQQFRGRMTQESSALLICYRALREVH